MKKLLLFSLFPILSIMAPGAGAPAGAEAGVAAAVEKLRAAMISGKAADLSAIAADSLVYIHSAGLLENKTEFIDHIASGRSVFVTIDLSDQIIKVADDIAVVRHTLDAKTNDSGKPGTVHLGVMTVWQKQNGEWKLIARQAQKLSCASAQSAVAQRIWQGIPGLERTPDGRLFFTWFTGGETEPRPENTVLLCHSDDAGKTLSPLQIMAAPKDGSRCYDPVPWLDPKGRLWYFFNRGNKTTAEHGVFARICESPDAPEPVFGPEFRVGFDVPFAFRLNKPTVLSTGEWALPVTFAKEPVHDWVVGKTSGQPALQGVAISPDEGKTWKLRGAVEAPPWALEGMVTELKDGRLWLLIRTGAGCLFESFSADKGATWSKGARSTIANPGARFFIRRLASGNLLLVNYVGFDSHAKKTNDKRCNLTAQLSTDDGKTWGKGLLLDPRKGISYPDGVQDKDGVIWITYDFDRRGAGEILMAKFREEDVAQGKNASGAVVLRQLINRLPAK